MDHSGSGSPHETLSVVHVELQDQVLDPGLAAALETTFDTLYFLECRGPLRGPKCLAFCYDCSCLRDGVDICIHMLNQFNG